MGKTLRYSRMTQSIPTFIIIALFSIGTATAQVKERFNNGESQAPQQEEKKAPEELKKTSKPKGSAANPWDKVVFGGDAALGFSTSSTFIYIAPSIGYRVTDNFTVGTGYIYQFSKINRAYNYSTNSWVAYDAPGITIHGPKAFFNFRFLESFYVGSQFEYLNHDFGYYISPTEVFYDNLWSPVWFLEAGFSQPIGRKGFAVVGIRINLLDDLTSPYATSWFPVVGVYF